MWGNEKTDSPMSLYDRDYYRQDMRPPVDGVPGSTAGGLSVTTWLIILNIVVFVFTYFARGAHNLPLAKWWAENMILWPLFSDHPDYGSFRPWQVVTSMFMHVDIWHILVNMWVLWMFGKGIEKLYGKWNYLAFYMTAGVVAGLLFVLTSALRGDPRAAVGASGAIAGVVVLFAFHFPRQKVYFWGIVPLLVWQLAVGFIAIDLAMFVFAKGGNIANAAHLGGAAFGVFYRYVDLRFESLAGLLAGTKPKPRPRVPSYFPDEELAPPPLDGDVRARVDLLLDKISREGLTSLTEEERAFLRDASNRYRT